MAVQAFARDEYSRNFDKTVTLANGQSVRVEHRMGNVNLRTHAGRDVRGARFHPRFRFQRCRR